MGANRLQMSCRRSCEVSLWLSAPWLAGAFASEVLGGLSAWRFTRRPATAECTFCNGALRLIDKIARRPTEAEAAHGAGQYRHVGTREPQCRHHRRYLLPILRMRPGLSLPPLKCGPGRQGRPGRQASAGFGITATGSAEIGACSNQSDTGDCLQVPRSLSGPGACTGISPLGFDFPLRIDRLIRATHGKTPAAPKDGSEPELIRPRPPFPAMPQPGQAGPPPRPDLRRGCSARAAAAAHGRRQARSEHAARIPP